MFLTDMFANALNKVQTSNRTTQENCKTINRKVLTLIIGGGLKIWAQIYINDQISRLRRQINTYNEVNFNSLSPQIMQFPQEYDEQVVLQSGNVMHSEKIRELTLQKKMCESQNYCSQQEKSDSLFLTCQVQEQRHLYCIKWYLQQGSPAVFRIFQFVFLFSSLPSFLFFIGDCLKNSHFVISLTSIITRALLLINVSVQ